MIFALVALVLHGFVCYDFMFERNLFNIENLPLRVLVNLGYAWYSTYGMYQLVKLVKGESDG